MKKFISLLFLMLPLFSSAAFAQVDGFGFKIGGQSAGAYSKPFEAGRLAGFSLYGFADIKLTPNLFSTLDVGYTQRGYTNSQEESGPAGQRIQTVKATSELSYISFAPFLNIPLRSAPVYIGAAPRFDLLVGTSPGTYEFTDVSVEDRVPENLNDVVFGGSVVAGIRDLTVGDLAFRVEAKVEMDITDSLDGPGTYRNNALMIVLGMAL